MGQKANQKIKSKDINIIVNEKYCRKDRSLTMNDCSKQWEKILASRDWSSLKKLDLVECKITGSKIKNVFTYAWPNLAYLNLVGNQIGSKGIKLLIKANLMNLQILVISYCQLGEQGVKHLVKSKWSKLRRMWIIKNNLRLNSYEALQNGQWKNLQKLIVSLEAYTFSDSISVLSLVTLQSHKDQIQRSIFNYKISQQIDRVFKNRFPKEQY